MAEQHVTFEGKLNDQPSQLWKLNDQKANKSGACQAIYWVKQNKTTNALRKDPNEGKNWGTGTVYKGEWQNNKKDGYGIQVWSNGNKYEGDWAKGFREGHGVFWIKKDGKLRKQYAGNWKKGAKSGLGVYFYTDGSRYEGNWAEGMRQSRGTLFFANGDVYVGDWNQDKQSGFGTLTRANQDVYEGEWLGGKREGAGIYYYKSKDKIYDGEWVNDIPKCGVYTSAEEFFDEEAEFDEDPAAAPKFKRKKARPIPELRLANPDAILAERIESIQRDRAAVRNLPFIELEKLFSEEGLDDLRRIFSMSDPDGSGEVPVTSLKNLFMELGFNVTEDELAQLLVDLDKTSKNNMKFSDFVKAAHLLDELKALNRQLEEVEMTGEEQQDDDGEYEYEDEDQ